MPCLLVKSYVAVEFLLRSILSGNVVLLDAKIKSQSSQDVFSQLVTFLYNFELLNY